MSTSETLHILSPPHCIYCLPPGPHIYPPPSLPHSGLACSLPWTASIGSLALRLLTESSQWNALVEISQKKENKNVPPDQLHPGPVQYVCVLLRHSSHREPFSATGLFLNSRKSYLLLPPQLPIVLLVLIYCLTLYCFA